ncbi:MAG: hypothetical protein AAF479_17035 [Pseudomonadota bacterium]
MDDASETGWHPAELEVETKDPYDLIPRIFDYARKASIELERLETRRISGGRFQISIYFRQIDPAVIVTLRRRVAQVHSGLS